MTFRLRIRTPDKTFFEEDVASVVCPGLRGRFGVLSRHIPLIGGLDSGIVEVSRAGEDLFFLVDGGLAEVRGTGVEILANAVLPAGSAADAEEKMQEWKTVRRRKTPYA